MPKCGVIFGPYFPVFGLNTEVCGVNSLNTEKYGPEITPYLGIFHAVKQSQFSKLLELDYSVFIHTRNIQSLATEMFRDSRNLSPPIMNDIFTQKGNSSYNLRQIFKFQDR